jgi:hypothetical protein
METKFYVYVYLDPRKKGEFIYGKYRFEYEPIYVGKGVRNRINQHLINVDKGKTSLFYNKLRKIIKDGFTPISIKLIERLTEVDSLIYEKELINLIGRVDIETGSLCNMTEGGEVGFTRTEEARKKISESKKGYKNPMYGKTTSEKQKESVKEAHELGKIKLTYEGRIKIIENNKKRKGVKNSNVRNDVIKYKLVSPTGDEYILLGAKELQKFCKDKKLQYHVIKNNENTIINEKLIIGVKINAKNTIGWKMEKC